MTERSERYTTVAITLHWVIAAAIIGMIFGGWYMSDLPDGAPGQYFLYQTHKSIGITVLLLTLARIAWRLMNPPPPLPADMKTLEKTASHIVHIGFYAIMILLPLTGWLYSSVSIKLDVPTVLFGLVSWPDMPFVEGLKTETASGAVNFIHSKLAWVTLALLALHIAGAVKHELSAEEGVLKRMIPGGVFGKTKKPERASKGGLISAGIALGALVLIAGTPAVLGAVLNAGQSVSAQSTGNANWTLDYASSSIAFSGIHDGDPFNGAFGNWDASISFNPDAPQTAEVNVSVAMGSASANQRLYTDSLKSPEWFNIAEFPTADVQVTDIVRVSDNSFTSTAVLTLKGQTVTADFPFTLQVDGDEATMQGQAVFQRKPLNLGQDSDPGADWVSEDVSVDVNVSAARTP